MSLLVIGTVALDNVKTPAGTKKNILGGSAAHFSMAARLFTKVALVGVVGGDFPKKYLTLLKRKRIDISSLQTAGGKTFRWSGEYKKNDLNTALTLSTKLGVIVEAPVNITEKHKNSPYVFLANIDPEQQIKLLNMMRRPKLVGLDSMNLWIEHKFDALSKLIKKVDLFVANDAEARSITGEHNLIRAAKFLRSMGPRLVVIKKGEHGVLFYSDSIIFSFPAYPVEHVIDPTGAGDTFAGGLMGYLAKSKKITKKTLKEAVLYATTIASFNVQGFGIMKTASLKISDVNKRRKSLVDFFSV